MARRTINVRDIFNLELESEADDGHFCMTFTSHKNKIKLHLGRWFIRPIAQEFWKFIKEEQRHIDTIKEAMAKPS